MTARVSRKLYDRNEGLSPAIRDIAWKGQLRLCSRYRRLAAAGKPKVVVTTAIAREMVGFIWAIARSAAGTQELSDRGKETQRVAAQSLVRTVGDRITVGNPPGLL